MVKPWELPKWVQARAREHGLTLDREAATALVAHVGERQQRLLRELEKLALDLGEGAHVDAAMVEELTASSAERRVWALGDALVARKPQVALSEYLALRAQGEPCRIALLDDPPDARCPGRRGGARGRRVTSAGQARGCGCPRGRRTG